jgi:diguanylate cyclase (GGDEF)-like protein
MAKLRSGSVIHIPDVSGLPPDAAVEKELLERQGIKSLLVLQVYAEKKLVGFIGFDNVLTTSAWCEADIDLLQIMAEIIGVAIARKQTDALIRHMAYHDALTNLPNRILFQDRLQRALILTKRAGNLVAAMILDLDCFKTINDSLGHRAGDLMLKIVAERLTQCVREGDTIARTGGDEFAIILPDLFHAKDAALVAQKIIGTLCQPLHLDGHIIAATASVGISIYPSDTDNTEELVMKADIAMYQAKKLGKNTYQFFNPDINIHG